ncbi:MAG: P-loop NTPase fold protein [Streptosporangiaceae bacterium]
MESDPATTNFMLLNDQPARGGGTRDVLGTYEAAVHLARLIEVSRNSTPFTVGIDAGWGMGKSSLMLQVQEQLLAQPDSGIQPVWFNAWTAEGASALDGLIKSVLMSLDENVLRRGLRKIISRRQLLSAAWILLVMGASICHLTRVADEIWHRFSLDARSRNTIRIQMADMFNQWTAKTKRSPNGRTLVVFIDDLDRCSNEVILQICEAMKLYLDVPGIAFVIGCDQALLGQAAIAGGRQSQNVANSSYLEKIIQVTYTKPMPFDNQVEELIDELSRKSGTEHFFSGSVKRIVLDRTGRNPRRIKRLINSFVLEYRLDPGWEQFGAEALIIIILMRQFYADFYHVIANPAADDIAAEFLTYLEIKQNVQRERPPADAERKYFDDHGVRVPGDAYVSEDLTRLEDVLPVAFPLRARESDFVSLLRTLSGREDFDALRHRLQRHPITTVTPQEMSTTLSAGKEEETALAGTHVLWVDDDPASVQGERSAVLRMGGTVEMVSTGEDARKAIMERSPDVLVSDITRAGDANAGFEDLRALREGRVYAGPAIFYTARVTPSRQRSAENLGARITTAPDILLDYLRSRSAEPAQAPSSPAARKAPALAPDEADSSAGWSASRVLDKAKSWSTGQL